MFRLGRDTRLKQATWIEADNAEIAYIEAWKYSKIDECRSDNFRHGVLRDSELDMWLHQSVRPFILITPLLRATVAIKIYDAIVYAFNTRGEFAKALPPVDAGSLEGTVRILFCEIPLGQIDKPHFLLGLQSFLKIEKAFHLSFGTIEAAFHRQGLYSRSFDYDSSSKRLNRVNVLVKAAQKVHVANYVLSLSHQVSDASTTALIMGTELLKTPPPRYALVDDSRKFEHLLNLIQNAARFWTHPMLLPTIILQNHSHRAEKYTYSLGQEVLNIEHQTGVAFPTHMVQQQKRSKEHLYAMTKQLHANMVQIIFTNRIYSWEIQYVAFLQKTHGELAEYLQMLGIHQELQECIEHIASVVTELADFARILKERTQSQLDIVCGMPIHLQS
ncbi:MAG: hypothetical protein Q9160_004479 [Pyrenula sp. 1 TL-2023]